MSRRYILLYAWVGSLAVAILQVATLASVELDRFQPIIERKPFGSEAAPQGPGSGPGEQAAIDEESFAKSIKISAFVRDKETGKLRVGLVSTKPVGSYLMDIGQTEDGVTLIAADFEREKVALRKEGKSFWLTMDGTIVPYTGEEESPTNPPATEVDDTAATINPPAPADGGAEGEGTPETVEPPVPATPPPVRASTPQRPPVSVPGVLRSGASSKYNYQQLSVPVTAADGRRLSYKERKKMRDEMLRKLRDKHAPAGMVATAPQAVKTKSSGDENETTVAVEPVATDPEMDKAIQEYQMQAIREGRQPLPVPLSPETDAQLVREGYLPAQ